jgi:hypothetical protein
MFIYNLTGLNSHQFEWADVTRSTCIPHAEVAWPRLQLFQLIMRSQKLRQHPATEPPDYTLD